MKNVLFLTSGLFFNPLDTVTREKFQALSQQLRGHVFGVVYEHSHKNIQLDNFTVNGLLVPKFAQGYSTLGGLYRLMLYCIFVIASALYLHYIRRDKLDAVIACDAFKTGLLAIVIGKLTGAKVGLDIVGNYVKAFKVNSPNPAGLDRLKQKFTLWVTPRVINYADGIKLLYEEQLDELPNLRANLKITCFHDVVPLARFQARQSTAPYILTAGHPWYLKGVDLVIAAFGHLHALYPQWRLKVVGYCPEPEAFYEMAQSFADKVDFFPNGVRYPDMVELMCNCSIFVLASRTEAMGRVLLEAMAAEKPVVASNVDGIPRIVENAKTGLLFASDDIQELCHKLDILMSNPALAREMGMAGAQRAHNNFSERQYANLFSDFIDSLSRDRTGMSTNT